MTQGGYQVIKILPIKSKMVAAKKQCFFYDFCTELSLHLRHVQSPQFTNDYKFGISVNTYQ